MTIDLTPWTDEPRLHSVLALFGGEAPALEEFARAWAADGQPLAVPARRLSSQLVQKCWAGAPPRVALGLQIIQPKRFWILWWQLRAKNWRLFYRRDPALPVDAHAGDVYLPWGQNMSSPGTGPPGLNLVLDKQELFSMPPTWNVSDDLFRRVADVSFSPNWTVNPTVQPSTEPRVPVQLGLRLVDKVPEISTNPKRELARVEQRIQDLQRAAGALRWQARDAPPPVQLFLYPEADQPDIGAGTQWDLRDWLASASDPEIDQLQHARVAVDGLGPTSGRGGNAILHLVAPASFGRPLTARLPRARKTMILELDPRWHRLGREVFVPSGQQLQPALPDDNPPVVEQMARALWGTGSLEHDRVLIFRWPFDDGEVRCLRIARTEFKPLATQTVAFNMPLAAQYHRSFPAPTDFTALLADVERSVVRALDTHVGAMCSAIETCWNTTRPEVETARQVIHAALQEDAAFLADVESWQKEIRPRANGLVENDWGRWAEFVRVLLIADRKSLPASRARLAGWLEYLDGVRAELAKLAWLAEPDQDRAGLAERLRTLAECVERGLDVRP